MTKMNKCNGDFYVFEDARLTVAKGDNVHSSIRPKVYLADEKLEVLQCLSYNSMYAA